MKQLNMFGEEEKSEEGSYTSKIKAPIYEPRNEKPHILELYDKRKFERLKNRINAKDVPQHEKDFLIFAATRHIVFNYQKIADYYSHSDKEIQDLMEQSALVIIDFDKAIENNFARMSFETFNQFEKDNEK